MDEAQRLPWHTPVTAAKKPTPAVKKKSPVDVEKRLRKAADAMVVSERRLERSPVLGPRAERTRRTLVESSWELFRTRGYIDTTVADIAKHAQVSLATFYQYFSELNDVLSVIVVDFIKESLERGVDRWDASAGRQGLRQMVDVFITTYIEYHEFMELWETAKLVSPGIRALSQDYAKVYRHHLEVSFQEGVAAGLIRSDIAPAMMADVMTIMLERYCYEHFVMSDERVPLNRAAMVELLTTMWADATKLVDATA